jgi:FkbM family methyltransferase
MLDVGSSYSDARHALRAICPQPLLNWREARFYGRYGEVELHLMEFLCRRDADALDIGANDGSYVHYMRRYARRVIGYEPMPTLVKALRQKFQRGVTIEPIALSDKKGTIELRMPVVDGVVVTGCSTVSDAASAAYPAYEGIEVPMERLDDVYSGNCGFIKIDVEGHQQAVLDGAVQTIKRCQPRMLVELEERLSPGGLGLARAYFDKLGYRGLFVHQGQLKPIDRFSVQTMQDQANFPSLTAPLTARQRFSRYIYNFIFLPPGEPESTVWKISERLKALSA